MKKTEKGITLVALIITIIVLLILAVVAINAVKGDGIIQYAESARDDYAAEESKENTLLHNYIGTLKGFQDKVNIELEEEGEEVTLLTFDYSGTEYNYEKGMNWGQWLASSYSEGSPFYLDGDKVCIWHEQSDQQLECQYMEIDDVFVCHIKNDTPINPNYWIGGQA